MNAVSIIYWFGIHILAAIYHRLKKDGVWSNGTTLEGKIVLFYSNKN